MMRCPFASAPDNLPRRVPDRWLGIVTLLTLLVVSPRGQGEADEIHFDRDIAPLLAAHCLSCHNSFDRKGGLDLSRKSAALLGGESGAALTPGHPADSLLWQRVTADEMPPEQRLTDEQKQRLGRWITSGMPWGTDPIDPFLQSSPQRAGYDWWSLQPVKRSPVPFTKAADDGDASWQNPIDSFIKSRLADAGLRPSPPADRHTLIRRLSFDLAGLPPTPEEVATFVADSRPEAYEQLVDRLLASPSYGERWARHWLDIARFGESQGFERDKLRDHAWRYRDWVAGALNSDMPYDQFARLQMAGDVSEDAGSEGIIAAGFLVAGPWDEVGQKQQSAAMKRVVRQDELEDYISAVGQTFLGLTINCARCHDHKFDPVSQTEYYQLAAALNGVRHGERKAADLPDVGSAIRATLSALERRIDALEAPVRQRLLTQRSRPTVPVTPPQPIARWTFENGLEDDVGPLSGTVHGPVSVRDGRLRVDGKTAYASTAPLDRDLTEKTLEVWVKLDALSQRGGSALTVQTLDGTQFDAIVFGEREPLRWMAGSDGFARTESFNGPEETLADREFVHVAIAWHADGRIAAYRNGVPYGQPYQASSPITFRKGAAQILFGLRHSPPGGNRFLAGWIDQAHLYDHALTPDEVAASAGVASDFLSEEELTAELSPTDRAFREQLKFEVNHLRTQRDRAAAQTVYSVEPVPQPDAMQVMLRGNPATPGDEVLPGGIVAVRGVPGGFQLSADATDAERRRALAAWITHPENPLFARVFVNRVWLNLFGAGFIATPSDFGFSGGQPTHPELLDWLAAEFVDSGYSVKHLQRLLVTSATYRQSSLPRAEALAVDANNQWVWRMSPRRLDAESLRDAILAVSGQLNDEVGGPGYHDFTTYVHNTQFYQLLDPVGISFQRRSLYRCWVRSGRNPFLDVFDCPDPSAMAPSRAVTTTPLQSLSLMNDSFVLRMSERLAASLSAESPHSSAAQVDAAFRRLYSRAATPLEQQELATFLDQHGLAALCRVLFNTNEFLYVE